MIFFYKNFNFNNVFKDITLWSEWSNCSLTCGSGVRTRSRKCRQNCDGVSTHDLLDTKTCNDFICAGELNFFQNDDQMKTFICF